MQNADLITLCIGGNNVMAAVQIPGFTRAYLPGLEAGTRRFERVYPQIIRELRRLNPHCRLLSMTVYNPIPAGGNPPYSGWPRNIWAGSTGVSGPRKMSSW